MARGNTFSFRVKRLFRFTFPRNFIARKRDTILDGMRTQ